MARKKYRADIDIQKIYDEAPVVNGKKKLDSLNFYHGCTNIIKWRLMPDLIYRGYYKDGVKQINYDEEDIEDCFTYILGKIHDKYDPKKGTLATFIRTWIRGYGQIIIQKQRRQYKYAKAFVSLDSTTNSNNIMEAHLHHDTRDRCHPQQDYCAGFLDEPRCAVAEVCGHIAHEPRRVQRGAGRVAGRGLVASRRGVDAAVAGRCGACCRLWQPHEQPLDCVETGRSRHRRSHRQFHAMREVPGRLVGRCCDFLSPIGA